MQLALLTLAAIILGGLVLARRPAPDRPYGSREAYAADGLRIVDIMTLQGVLTRYRMAEHRYPPSLEDLLPLYSPVDRDGLPLARLPVDPGTGRLYTYLAWADGSDYELAATLSNGRRFTGFAHNRAGATL